MSYGPNTIFVQTQAVTVANSAAETAVTGTGTGSLVLPAGFFTVGKVLLIELFRIHSAVANPNITVKVKFGSTVIANTGAIVTANSTNEIVQLRAMITCYTTGAGGTAWIQGFWQEAGNGAGRFSMANTAATSVDTTASQTISATVQWGTASASNTLTVSNVLIRHFSTP